MANSVDSGSWALISNALGRYAWAYDMDQMPLLEDCFSLDAEVVFSTGLQRGKAAVLTELERRRAKYRPLGQTPWHVITNVFVRPLGSGHAAVSAYWSFGVRSEDQPTALTKFGWYDDVFIEHGGTWLIHRRRILGVGEQ